MCRKLPGSTRKFLNCVASLGYHLAIFIAAVWCCLVALYSPALSSPLRHPTAFGFVFLYLLFLIRPALYRIPAIACLVALVYLWQQITPTNSADWQTDVAQLPWVEQNGDDLTFHNVRDFYYRTDTDYDARYVTKNVRLSELSSVDIFTTYWAGKNLAHIFVSFGFNERDFISVSIEARKTKQQSYSTSEGFFRNFHLTYIVAEERDLVALRTQYRQPHEQVYLLRGRFNRTRNTRFLLKYISKINDLRENPAFYNTLTTNCTTQVLANAKAGNPLLRYNWRILFSGHTPEYLYLGGALDTHLSLEELMQLGYVNPRTQDVADAASFSRNIRQGIPRPPPMDAP